MTIAACGCRTRRRPDDVVLRPAKTVSLAVPRRIDPQVGSAVWDIDYRHKVHMRGPSTVDTEVIDVTAVCVAEAQPAQSLRSCYRSSRCPSQNHS